MPAERSDDAATGAARDFARSVSEHWKTGLGADLIGVYLLGSLAHGGFSRRYSDIDMALIAEAPMTPGTLDLLRHYAAIVSNDLSAKLSIFWADRGFSTGRFPVLDRIDYLDHAVPLMEREPVRPARPGLAEVRAYLSGAPLANWSAEAQRLAAADTLESKDHKPLLRALLYPARFVYSWTTGRVASNDDAVAFLTDHAPPGVEVALVTRALECRRAAADPDQLFAARDRLPRIVAACARFVAA
jgi:predicted nucleotidyltransferase